MSRSPEFVRIYIDQSGMDRRQFRRARRRLAKSGHARVGGVFIRLVPHVEQFKQAMKAAGIALQASTGRITP